MDQPKLNEILNCHKLWLETRVAGNVQGKRANLQYADLQDANLRGADLRSANLRGANLHYADLHYADLQDADLRVADLRGANIDHSCLPLWCGSLAAHFDDRQLKQIAYHLVKAGMQSVHASPETKAELIKIADFANESHLADWCGQIELEEKENGCS